MSDLKMPGAFPYPTQTPQEIHAEDNSERRQVAAPISSTDSRLQALTGGKTFVPLRNRQKARLDQVKVQPGTFAPRRLGINLVKGVGDALQEATGTAIGAGLVTYAASSMRNPDTDNSNNAITQAVTASFAVAATNLVKNSISTIVNQRTLDERGAHEETYAKLKKDITPEYLARYPEDIKTAARATMEEIDHAIRFGTQSATWLDWKIKHLQLVILSRPLEAKNLMSQAPQDKQRRAAALEKLLSDYPEKNHGIIETMVQKIQANSVRNEPQRVQAYLYGPAGTGKTRFARELAKVLDVPLVTVKIPAKNLDSILGTQWDVSSYTPTTQDSEIIGELPLKLIKAGCTNPIVLIDELELTGNNLNDLKLLLDPSKKELKIGGYDANLDWSRATILIGSNDPLENEALQTRVSQIVFDNVSNDVKKSVAQTQFNKTALVYAGDLTHAQNQRLVSTCNHYLDELIALDNENFPGVRFLESVSENLVHLVAKGLNDGKPKTTNEIRYNLQMQYAQAKGKPEPGADILLPSDRDSRLRMARREES
ncbi:AAA family ATPase [Trinickia terrae]|uniref:AAA family ATPase n=1 Tax=Trinickia terrae TaxID=2571161 RepID=A0A4V5PJT0_9BURK|nr:AAA family ATPase [Trinickia terrae]TKC92610.1 AAA family ATPase [Trinickia terrae]